MAKIQAKSALPSVRRIFEDEYVQEQLRNAAGNAWGAFRRARKQPAKATQDKGFYRNLREATTSLAKAKAALKPAKPKPKRRGRKLATVALAIGATALVTIKLQEQQARRTQTARSPTGNGAPARGADVPDESPKPEPAVPDSRG